MQKKKILLIGPYKNSGLRVGQYLSPPLGIYRIKSYIEKKASHQVDIIDLDLEGKDYFINKLKNNKYDIIGFSILQPTLKNDIALVYEAKKLSPDSLIIAGGQGAVFNHKLLLNQTPTNVIVKGFGEFALLEIINNPGQLQKIKGLYIKENSKIIDTGIVEPYTYEQLREISLSFDFNKVPYEEYWNFMEKVYTKKHLEIMKNEDFLYTIRLMTSTHCPRKCSFCSSTNFLDNACKNQQRIALSGEDVYSMVKRALISHPKCKAIYFNDDDFLFDKKRIKELCFLLKNIKDISYFCLSRVDNIDKDLLRLMKKTGFKFIIYGVESFSDKILKDMCKNLTINNRLSKQVIKDTIDIGLTPLMNLILFYPTASIGDIITTIENAIELVEYDARLTVYPYIEAYPGSNILKQENLDFTYEKFNVRKKRFILPNLILPRSKKIRLVAEESIKIREGLLNNILKERKWTGVVPHPLQGLTLFLAVYKILNLRTARIESLINRILAKEEQEQRIAVSQDIIRYEVCIG